MDNIERKICQKVEVNKSTYKYRLFIEVLQVLGEIFIMLVIFFAIVPQYISWKKYILIVDIIVLLDIFEMILSLLHLKNNYICYEEKGKFLTFFIKDFYSRKSHIALSHIKYIMISQNIIQKKYDLADIIISTGVTKHKFQSLSKKEADDIKNELGELMSENAYKNE